MSSQANNSSPKKTDNRRLGDNSVNLSPEKSNVSQIPMNKDPEELKREEEEEKANAEFMAEQLRRQQEMQDLVQIQRSDYISPVELGVLQSNFMKSIEVGGFFGLDPVPLDKTNLFKTTPGQGLDSVPLIQAEPKRDFLKKDGIFTSASEFSLPTVEIQRLEQRLLWENKKEWFRPDNGKLVMDSEFFEERITTMRDTETSKNPNLNTFTRNAYLSERQNQKKNQYYKLDLIIGKIFLSNHPLFCDEDRKAAILKAQIREFKEKSEMALLPHLRGQVEKLRLEFEHISVRYDVPPKQLEILDKEIALHENLLAQEEKDLQGLVDKIYATWGEIQKIRRESKFVSTTVKLNVRQYMSEEDTKELDMFITHQNTDNAATNKSLPSTERARRQRIMQNRVYVRVFINDNYVCRTKKAFIDWPNMEVQFLEKFQVFLFTKPGSIKLQVVMGTFREYTIDTVEIDIPGETVNTLTSASMLYREKDFKKEISKVIKKTIDPNAKTTQETAGAPGTKKEEEKKDGKDPKAPNAQAKPKVEYQTVNEVTHSGIINYKAEWHGTGNTFPPPAIDKFGVVKHGGIKLKTVHTIDEGVIDLNDPRNETLIDQLRDLKNKQIQDLLIKDAKMPLAELDSLRHRILRLRHQKLSLSKRKIPITENEIYQNEEFMKLLRDEEEEIQKFLQDEYVFARGYMLKDQALDVDRPPESYETKQRIKNHRKKLYMLSQETLKDKQKDLSSHLSLKSVVNEFYFEEDTDPIAEFIKSLFEQRGKLRPKKKAQDKVSAKRTNQTDILIHCVKGTNVPVRAKAFMIVQALKAGGFTPNSFNLSRGGGGYGNSMIGGYGGPQPGDTNMMASQYGGMNMSSGFGNPQQPNQPMPTNVRNFMEQNPMMKGAISGWTPSDTLDIERVLSFIEVTLFNPDTGSSVIVKTETFEGISPEWNDNLTIPYKAFNDEGFDLKELIETNCILYFTLFDMVGIIQKHDKQMNNFNINIEKRYLGSFQVPLVTLFQNPKMDAQFKVDRPLFLLGYFNMKANVLSASEIVTDPSQPTHVTLSIGLNPVIEIPSRNEYDYYGGAENPDLLLRGSAWIKHLKEDSKFASKNIRLWAENINKKAKLESHFLPRYLTPLNPPFEPVTEDCYNQCARYVALIPFKSDAEAFKDVPDIWCTSQEFLDLKGGDSEEHAILLCCYFMYIDKELKKDRFRNYLIVGKGVPEGDTVYVLRKNLDNQNIEIWNATSGDPYYFERRDSFNECCCIKLSKSSQIDIEKSDSVCPLKEITCIVNDENVWVNIQPDVSPNTVLFDLDNKSHWVPFLDEKMKKEYFKEGKIETIQPQRLVYDDIDIDYCNNLQYKLAVELKKRLTNYRASDEDGRNPKPTVYDEGFGQHVRDIMLLSFELFKYTTRTTGIHSPYNPKSNTQDSIKQITDITNSIINLVDHTKCDVYGIPLNMPYLGLDKIWQMIKNTDIMNIENPDVKYVLEVAVKPYPHFVNSVWIYVGVIFTKPIK